MNYSLSRFDVNKLLSDTDTTGSALSGTDWAFVRVLDSALAKIKNAPPTRVYRGTSRKGLKLTKPGQFVRLKGFTSTTPNREVAEGFIRDRFMIINVISGKTSSRIRTPAWKRNSSSRVAPSCASTASK